MSREFVALFVFMALFSLAASACGAAEAELVWHEATERH